MRASGLDSQSAFHIMRHVVQIAHITGLVVVVSIHQPSNAVFNLFDDLLLLNEGRTVYMGPVRMVRKYFKR